MNQKHVEAWNKCLRILRDNMKEATFNTWFTPLEPLQLIENTLTLQVPSQFYYEYIEENFLELLAFAVRSVIGKNAKLEYNILIDKGNGSNGKPATINYPSSNGKVSKNTQNVAPAVTFDPKAGMNPFAVPGLQRSNFDSHLRPQHTFENFIVGPGNTAAYHSALKAAENPGQTGFSPLLIYGNSGVGKTHLIQAIGLKIREVHPKMQVLYVHANNFIQEFSEASINNTRNNFLQIYQNVDVLIIDDIHDFSSKTKSQDSLFHIFNHLHQMGKQLVFACDRAPVELEGLDDRLLSRFKWGASIRVEIPDFETRRGILKMKAYNDGLVIPEEIIDFLANRITTNSRELQGSMVSLLAYATDSKSEITLELAQRVADEIVKRKDADLNLQTIRRTVCDYLNVDETSLESKSRKREIVDARQISMYLAKEYTSKSLSTIGQFIGKKDHSTVLHAYKSVRNMMDTNKKFRETIEELCSRLGI